MSKQPSVSPARAAGLWRPRRSARTCWTRSLVLPLWTPVALKCDPRHEGEVCATSGLTITVRWTSGWKSEHQKSELEAPQ